jgi:hypothetical protein
MQNKVIMNKDLLRVLVVGVISSLISKYAIKALDKRDLLPQPIENE